MKPGVLFVFHDNNPKSGATSSLLDIVLSLVKSDEYEIYAAFPFTPGGAGEILSKVGVEVSTYKYGQLIQILSQPLCKRIIKYPLLLTRHLFAFVEAFRAAKYYADKAIRVVYSNTSTQVFGSLVAKRLRTKQIWHIREYRIPDHGISFYLGDAFIQRYIQDNSDAVLCVSKSVLDYHASVIDKRKMAVTYNSYPASLIDARTEFAHGTPLKVLIAGGICKGKGQLDVVKAVRIANKFSPGSFELHIAGGVGEEAYYQEINDYITFHHMEGQVIIHGFVSSMKELRASMDIGVVASRQEAFGRTTIEGMLSMMAMVGRASGGTTEQIEDGITGLLYDGSPEMLSEKLLRLRADRAFLERLARQGFAFAVANFTTGFAASVAESTIRRVLGDEQLNELAS